MVVQMIKKQFWAKRSGHVPAIWPCSSHIAVRKFQKAEDMCQNARKTKLNFVAPVVVVAIAVGMAAA
eukprot:565892-Amphidinium_carterae.1